MKPRNILVGVIRLQVSISLRSVYSSGSRTQIIFTIRPALPVCAHELSLVLHVSIRSPAEQLSVKSI